MILTVLLRTVFFYFFLLTVLRLMGKRELGALGPLDLVVSLIMAEAATIPIESPDRPLWLGVVPIVTIMGLEIILSYLCLVNERLRRLISGVPTVVIKDGRFVQSEMRKLRYSIRELLERLREKGFDSVLDVETAILESDGGLSVIPRSDGHSMSAADIELPSTRQPRTHVLVIDGQIDRSALHAAGMSEDDLHSLLAERGCAELRRVFLAVVDGEGRLHVQKRK